jgi:hypothetical protein
MASEKLSRCTRSADKEQHDLYRTGSHHLVWRGTAHDTLSGTPKRLRRNYKSEQQDAQQIPRTLAQHRQAAFLCATVPEK